MKCRPFLLVGLLSAAAMLAACHPTPQAADVQAQEVRADEDRAAPVSVTPAPTAENPASLPISGPVLAREADTAATAAQAVEEPVAPTGSAPPPVLSAAGTATAEAVQLVAGTQLVVDESVVLYSPDARLQLSTGATVSTTTGVLLSDPERAIIGGDLAIETPHGYRMEADEAIIETTGPNQHVMTAKSLRLVGPTLPPANPSSAAP